MELVIKIIGVVITLAGVLFLLKPDVLKSIIKFFGQGKRVYVVGMLRIILAIVFLSGARQCDISWVIVVVGIIFLISGILIFMFGDGKMKSMLEWYLKRTPLFLRIPALIAIVIGAVILYSA